MDIELVCGVGAGSVEADDDAEFEIWSVCQACGREVYNVMRAEHDERDCAELVGVVGATNPRLGVEWCAGCGEVIARGEDGAWFCADESVWSVFCTDQDVTHDGVRHSPAG